MAPASYLTAFGAFGFGLGLFILPSVVPLLTILKLRPRKFFEAGDLWWLLAIALTALPHLLHRTASPFLTGIIYSWLIYKASRKRRFHPTLPFGVGAILGLLLTTSVGWWQVGVLGWPRATGWSWIADPNLFGHTVLSLSGFALLTVSPVWLKLTSIPMLLSIILVTGSRSTLLGALLLLTFYPLTSPRWRSYGAAVLLLLVLSASSLLWLGSTAWGERLLRGLQLVTDLNKYPLDDGARINLITSSENLDDAVHWHPLLVNIEEAGIDDETGQRIWAIYKSGPEPWARPQQTVTLLPGTTYTLGLELKSLSSEAEPGILGWGRTTDTVARLSLSRRLGSWVVESSDNISVSSTRNAARPGGWERLEVTFSYLGKDKLSWSLGPTPDQRSIDSRSGLLVRRLQLESADRASDYQPTYQVMTGQGTILARFAYWQAAWRGFLAHPIWGLGPGRFPAYYRANLPPRGRSSDIPAHTHDLFLQVAFETGLVGIAGLLVFLGALSREAFRNRNLGALVLLTALLVANIFDYTLTFGAILYPLPLLFGGLGDKRG